MSPLARRLLIIAAIDGLILQPLQNSRSRTPPTSPGAGGVKLEYKTNKIVPYTAGKQLGPKEEGSSVEAHGIVGLLNVSPSNSFLIAITGREQVATIRERLPVYVITNVALIPLSSRTEAARAIEKAKSGRKPLSDSSADSGSDTEGEVYIEDDDASVVDDDIQDDINVASNVATKGSTKAQGQSSIGKDVLAKKGQYGRFAEKWFSKRGWTVDRRRAEGMTAVDDEVPQTGKLREEKEGRPTDYDRPENKPQPDVSPTGSSTSLNGFKDELDGKVEDMEESMKDSVAHSLTPKLLHTTKLLLATSRSFYFSYDYDLTRSLATQIKNSSGLPLYRIVDDQFFWNRHLQKELIDAGQHSLVLPIMQGFVNQRTFSAPKAQSDPLTSTSDAPESTIKVEDFAGDPVPVSDPAAEQSFLLTLISRRTIHRAGLRYLRRGVDDAGHAANGVETEQLLSTPSWDRIWSYVQIRASIPLYFSQSPYSFKPRPVLHQSEEANAVAFRAHFKQIRDTYGDCHCVSLVEQHGPEAIVGDKYQVAVETLNSSLPENVSKIGWTWFDFHRECRGMRFENVSRLFDDIEPVLDKFAYSAEIAGKGITQHQSGVLRTNCMDCLDRTNVVQAGSARRALDSQLATIGVTLDDNKMSWFNIMWADNGDAISKQYASTAALKGDFTRTRKRNLQGALTDFGLTINRYFNNIISDFFTQAAIDFLLGNVTSQVFVDFEAEMSSSDPAVSMRRIRQNAIEISSKIVVEDESEELRGGWTFLAPNDPTRRGPPMTEVVLLLTDCALYRCDFDWALEKVSAFERVRIEDVKSIKWGTYITSTLASSHVDESRNVGFAVSYESEKREVIRVNTRSLQTSFSKDGPSKRSDQWAFKAMPAAHAVTKKSDVDGGYISQMKEAKERESVEKIVGEIKVVCGDGLQVNEEEIVSLQEAKKGTGLLEQWSYNIKRFVWA